MKYMKFSGQQLEMKDLEYWVLLFKDCGSKRIRFYECFSLRFSYMEDF